jgi:arginine exporter protein ArgO
MMNDIESMPKYMRYDFFLAAIGILGTYFVFSNNLVYYNSVMRIIFICTSAFCFMYGLFEMKGNYEQEKIMQSLEREYRSKKITIELEAMR